jgi:hypothetical protein
MSGPAYLCTDVYSFFCGKKTQYASVAEYLYFAIDSSLEWERRESRGEKRETLRLKGKMR